MLSFGAQVHIGQKRNNLRYFNYFHLLRRARKIGDEPVLTPCSICSVVLTTASFCERVHVVTDKTLYGLTQNGSATRSVAR